MRLTGPKRGKSKATWRAAKGLLLLFLFSSLFVLWYGPAAKSWLGRYQGIVYDAFVSRNGGLLDPRIVIIDVDEESLSAVGRWPWARDQIATLLRRIQERQPAVIGLDILFPEPSTPAADGELAVELSRDNVVSAVTFGLSPPSLAPTNDETVNWPVANQRVGLADSLTPASGEPPVAGHITPVYDADFVIRRLYPVICYENCLPVLSFRILQVMTGQSLHYVPGPVDHRRVCVGAHCLYLNPDNTVYIPYQHSSRFRYIPARALLERGHDLPDLAGAIVLVGTSAVGLGDRVSTPRSVNTPGVEIHALLLAATLDNVRWVVAPFAKWWLTAGLLIAAALAWCWGRASRRDKIAIVAGWAVLVVLPVVLARYGYWLSPLLLWITIGAFLVTVVAADIALVRAQRRKILGDFQAYVPPVVLDKLVREDLSLEQLDAQRSEVTVLFADIQGFTSLSEKLEPEQLVEITGHLFTQITEEIYQYKGTLDKYMGDSVMAFWGAPLPDEYHHTQAASCALAIRNLVQGLEPWLVEKGYPSIKMTMGLETGVVTVGNLGSRQRRAYTIMGKTANLASHLQRQCEELGVDILFGPELTRRLQWPSLVAFNDVSIRGIAGEHKVSYPRP